MVNKRQDAKYSRYTESDTSCEWRDVVGYETHYEVSDTGRVRSKERIVEDMGGRRRRVFPSTELVQQDSHKNERWSVALYNKTKRGRHFVHRLVAEAFHPNPNNLPVVDHIDGDPGNNHASNLRWASHHTNNNNIPYTRYLRSLLDDATITYMTEEEFNEHRRS